jgi:hypothetical protein
MGLTDQTALKDRWRRNILIGKCPLVFLPIYAEGQAAGAGAAAGVTEGLYLLPTLRSLKARLHQPGDLADRQGHNLLAQIVSSQIQVEQQMPGAATELAVITVGEAEPVVPVLQLQDFQPVQ